MVTARLADDDIDGLLKLRTPLSKLAEQILSV
jgi:hypothetical protein